MVSFTKPFLNLGVSILFLKPEPSDPGPFSFLAPLGNSGPVKNNEYFYNSGIDFLKQSNIDACF